MEIYIFSLFPEMFAGPMNTSILKRAQDKGLLSLNVVDFREYSLMKHKNVDDSPFGGGAGMVLKPEPLYDAVEDTLGAPGAFEGQIILLSPQGQPFTQKLAKDLAKESKLAFICGHYEGFDERIRPLANLEISMGDFVLTGGELPAMVIIDAVSRLLPGVLGEEDSPLKDSFYEGLLEYPQYTRPRSFRGMSVPEVLVSGNHEQIRLWRRKEALRRTLLRRPDLLVNFEVSREDQKLLMALKEEGIHLEELEKRFVPEKPKRKKPKQEEQNEE